MFSDTSITFLFTVLDLLKLWVINVSRTTILNNLRTSLKLSELRTSLNPSVCWPVYLRFFLEKLAQKQRLCGAGKLLFLPPTLPHLYNEFFHQNSISMGVFSDLPRCGHVWSQQLCIFIGVQPPLNVKAVVSSSALTV